MFKNSSHTRLAGGMMKAGMPNRPGAHCQATRKITNSNALPITIWRMPGCRATNRALI
jgi:hypothetical protein